MAKTNHKRYSFLDRYIYGYIYTYIYCNILFKSFNLIITFSWIQTEKQYFYIYI